ncbi:MAG: ribosome maturation factor RimM [Nitratireductor sp.]
MTAGSGNKVVTVAKFGAAHGIKGEVRLKSFTEDPFSVGDFGTLQFADGKPVRILSLRPQGEMLIARVEGCKDRNQAELLNGLELFIERSELPELEDEDEFYLAELTGLEVRENGAPAGKVLAVHDFGAGELLEIRPLRGPGYMLAFTRENVPVVNVSGGYMEIVRPVETGEREPEKRK